MLSFTAVGLMLATLGFALDISGDVIRNAGAAVLFAFGTMLLVPRLQLAFAGALAPISAGPNSMLDRIALDGPGGKFALGALLGLIWAPCTGPTLGAAIGLAAQSEHAGRAALTMAIFSVGAASPLLLLAYGSRQALARRRDQLARISKAAKPAMGLMMATLGLLVWAGLDKRIEAGLTHTLPDWLIGLTTRF